LHPQAPSSSRRQAQLNTGLWLFLGHFRAFINFLQGIPGVIPGFPGGLRAAGSRIAHLLSHNGKAFAVFDRSACFPDDLWELRRH
jgi:hypothetical protein